MAREQLKTRERAYRDGKLVTVLSGRPGKRGKATIRNQFGFVEEVPAKDLEPIPDSEPESRLRFGPAD